MTQISYAHAPMKVRDDLVAEHRRAWQRVGSPGTWLDGRTRVAIAAETRNAVNCRLCRRRKESLSPYSVKGAHESLGTLPEMIVDVVHRIVSDPGRLTHDWYQSALRSGLSDAEYVETVGVVITTVSLDTFARGLGIPTHPLPSPISGVPTRKRPKNVKMAFHWVPTLAPEDLTEDEVGLYHRQTNPANIRRALSLVPSECKGWFDLAHVQYLAPEAMSDFEHEHRAITRAQIELLAARVSSLNQCFY